jgi:UMF1 family MFS transporter
MIENGSFPSFRGWLQKPIVSWILYDIASSGYLSIIPSIVYVVYYRQFVCGGESVCDVYWATWTSLALLIAGLAAPLFGAIADLGGLRHRLFITATLFCGVATAMLYWVTPGAILFGGVIFLLAHVGYLLAMSLYDAYMPDLVPPHQMRRLSGLGWGLGFLGALVCNGIYQLLAAKGQLDEFMTYRVMFVIVAIYFMSVSLPAFVWLPRQTSPEKSVSSALIFQSYRRVLKTLRNWKKRSDIFKFLLGFYLLSDGIVTIITFFGIYLSTQFGLATAEILRLAIIFQILVVPLTIGCGFLGDRWSARSLLGCLLGIWFIVILLMVFSTHPVMPVLIVVGLSTTVASTQSLCRGLFAQMIHSDQAAELFGLNAFVSKISAVVGPLLFGAISLATGSQRLAIASTFPFFVIGGWILLSISFDSRK